VNSNELDDWDTILGKNGSFVSPLHPGILPDSYSTCIGICFRRK